MIKRLILTALIPAAALLMAACKDIVDPGEILARRPGRFYVYDHTEPQGPNNPGNYYLITAEKKATGQRCEVWVEAGANVSVADAQSIANEYDAEIYPVINGAFGFSVSDEGQQTDILEIGDVDENGRLLLLLLDIKDSYSVSNNSYIAGYFNPNDLFSRWQYFYSNEADMIYLDINPGVKGGKSFYATIAHELQHLIHFLANLTIRSDDTYRGQDTWIDEGLSSVAEYLYLEDHAAIGRVKWFNDDPDKTIATGNNFFVWDGGLDEYATVYLFFQWLRIQSGGNEIFRDIIMSEDVGVDAVCGPAGVRIGGGYGDWETLLRTWFAANYIGASSGIYGYQGQISPVIHTVPGPAFASIPLKPGEGVYSVLSGGNTFSGPANIAYAGLNKGSAAVDTEPPRLGDRLLTFNKNSNTGGLTENGQTTGVAASLQPHAAGALRTMANSAPQGPYPIGVRDYLGGRLPGPDTPQLPSIGNHAKP